MLRPLRYTLTVTTGGDRYAYRRLGPKSFQHYTDRRPDVASRWQSDVDVPLQARQGFGENLVKSATIDEIPRLPPNNVLRVDDSDSAFRVDPDV